MKPVTKLLRMARVLISDENHWLRDLDVQSSKRPGEDCRIEDADADQFCLYGAVCRATFLLHGNQDAEVGQDALTHVQSTILSEFTEMALDDDYSVSQLETIARFNETNDHADVVKVLTAAIDDTERF